MQGKSFAECSKEHSAILLTFIILPFVIKILIGLYLSGRFTQVLLYKLNGKPCGPADLDLHCCLKDISRLSRTRAEYDKAQK